MKDKLAPCAFAKYIHTLADNYYFSLMEDNFLGFVVLFLFLNHLRDKEKPIQYFKDTLFMRGSLNSDTGQYLYCHTVWTDKNNPHNVCIATTQIEEELSFAESLQQRFPYFTLQEIQEYIYVMPLQNFLQILQAYLEHAHKKTPYMCLYEDQNKWVHFIEYQLTPKQLEAWKNKY